MVPRTACLIFAATDEEFSLIFRSDEDIAFIDEVYQRRPAKYLDAVFAEIPKRRIPKANSKGIHGTLYYGLERKKSYYPTRRDEEAVNPDAHVCAVESPNQASAGDCAVTWCLQPARPGRAAPDRQR